MPTTSDEQSYPRRTKRTREFRGGLEEKIDTIGWVLFLTSLLLAIVCLLATLLLYAMTMRAVVWVGVIGAIAVFASGFVSWGLFAALAEILRIQKKAVGVSYSGEISTAYSVERLVKLCGKCGAMLHSESTCDQCGCVLDRDEFID